MLLKYLKFRQIRCQRSGESASQFVADLKSLAEPCKFGALRDKLIRDQLIEKTNSARVREKLLMEDDRLALDKTLTLALQIEEATQCVAKIAETNAAKTDDTSVPANIVMSPIRTVIVSHMDVCKNKCTYHLSDKTHGFGW